MVCERAAAVKLALLEVGQERDCRVAAAVRADCKPGLVVGAVQGRRGSMAQCYRILTSRSTLAGCGRKVRRSAAVCGASTVSAAFGK